MFTIKKIEDPRLGARVCGSFGLDGPDAFACAAYENGEVLATAAFLRRGDCVVFCGADTGRRTDVPMIDGMVRAAFAAQVRAGAKNGELGKGVPADLRLALTKFGYPGEAGPFDLGTFFSRRNCARK